MEWMDLMQWPAMAATAAAAWLTGSRRASKRTAGFYCYLLGNALWAAWGFHVKAWAVILLQVALTAINVRGALHNQKEA